MERLEIIVPVATFEPLSVIRRSVESICKLASGDMDVWITYVIDVTGDDDPRLAFLEEVPSDKAVVIPRYNNRGRRAGAINDVLDTLSDTPDYIALFDVDSRPDYDFLIECVRVLKLNETAIIASGARFVTNEDEGIVPKTIAAECLFFSDVYEEFAIYDGFNQFNGLIGVLDAKLMVEHPFEGLDESVPCEDLDFTQHAYLAGLTGVFTPNTMVGEQAPVSIGELFNQRTRWLSGAYVGLRNHLSQFIASKIPASRRIAWFLTLSLPFVAVLMMPAALLYGIRLWGKNGLCCAVVQTAGLLAYLWLITLCGVVVLVKQVFGNGVEWKDTSRSDV